MKSGEDFRIATFNLENLDDAKGGGGSASSGPDFTERLAVLRPQLARLDADILCLQEVNSQRHPGTSERVLRALDALLSGTGYEGFHRLHSHHPSHGEADAPPADIHNLVILSRFPFRAQGQVWHDLVPPPAWSYLTADRAASTSPSAVTWDRPFLRAAVDLPGAPPLYVFNIHLRAPLAAFIPGQKEGPFSWRSSSAWAEGFFLAGMKRSGQALEARFAMEAIFDDDPDALIAVCGDFNAGLDEIPGRILRAGEGDTGNGRLARRVMAGIETTVAQERRYSVIHGGRRRMLDHILVSRRLLSLFREAEIHNEALEDELVGFTSSHAGIVSYHAPLVARFSLPG